MLDQFQEIEQKYNEVERKISDPEIISDQAIYKPLLQRHAELKEGVELYHTYCQLKKELDDLKQLKGDPDMADMIEEESSKLTAELEKLDKKLYVFLVPPDPDDHRNAIVEIRSGTGGEEAALFAYELFRMYSKYAESCRWKVEILNQNMTELGGIKEVVFLISGKGVYRRLKFESGTHRVQRVPATETQGRVHTSAATVAIMPEAEDVDIQIDMKDVRVDTYRASGSGGQHVNKTDSAVRLTHMPSGIVVACQDERSQFQNKDKALRVLRTRLYDKTVEDRMNKESSSRKLQVGTGDRSQKIRTYNYPQSRVTDHRVGLTLYCLDEFLQGKMDMVLDVLIQEETVEKMKK